MSDLALFSPIPVLRAVLLDTGPLSLAANPKANAEGKACNLWIAKQLAQDVRIIVPEITDYEVRRELLRSRLKQSVLALEMFTSALEYLPLNTDMMRQAALFWAQVRQAGRPTADRHALDGDAILAAQAVSLGYAPGEVVVATTNVGHLSQFVTAHLWPEIG